MLASSERIPQPGCPTGSSPLGVPAQTVQEMVRDCSSLYDLVLFVRFAGMFSFSANDDVHLPSPWS